MSHHGLRLLRAGPALLALATFLGAGSTPEAAALWPNRREFQRAMRRVAGAQRLLPPVPGCEASRDIAEYEGMSAREVLAILGRPDDVVVERPNEPDPTVTWCYGTNGHGTFPTLGRVRFNERSRVSMLSGGCPDPPVLRGISEGRLRELLRDIDAVPDPLFSVWSFDPRPLIRAVNALQSLGREKALAVVGEYLRVTMDTCCEPQYWCGDGSQRLYPVMNLLFEAPDAPDFDIHFIPILVQDDVPILMWFSAGVGGALGFPPEALDHYRKHGTFRARPLTPPERPLDIVAYLDATRGWERVGTTIPNETKRLAAMNQLLRLIEPVYPTEADRNGNRIAPGEDLDARWRRILEEVARLPIRWDARRQTYIATFRTPAGHRSSYRTSSQ